jgi:hypothetical protein
MFPPPNRRHVNQQIRTKRLSNSEVSDFKDNTAETATIAGKNWHITRSRKQGLQSSCAQPDVSSIFQVLNFVRHHPLSSQFVSFFGLAIGFI